LLGIEVLFLRPTDKHLGLLADKLEDVHPEVRLRARKHLRELARKKELRDKIINEATRVLGGKSWQGLEQATILLAQLDHKPAAGRLVELLAFPRPEVYVSAAWGLRVLAVSETLPGVVSFVIPKEEQLREAGARRQPTDSTIDHQLSQLNQFLGRQKYRPAEPVLRRFIPRMEMPLANPVGVESRAAAIWALGLIHEGKSVPDLAPALEERLNDVSSIPPEDFRVRRMSAITLGRIKAKEALTSLRNFCPRHQPDLHPVINACGWAVEKLTGETFPPPKPILRVWRDWFLTPN
jgi:HEAT repeat protein